MSIRLATCWPSRAALTAGVPRPARRAPVENHAGRGTQGADADDHGAAAHRGVAGCRQSGRRRQLAEPLPIAVAPAPAPCGYGSTRRFAEVQDRRFKEASGLAASQRWPGIYWALNDSGNAPEVFAMDDQGQSRGTFRVEDAQNVDWEAMQVGPGRDGGSALYVGDIGDNDRERREVVIYRVPSRSQLGRGPRLKRSDRAV